MGAYGGKGAIFLVGLLSGNPSCQHAGRGLEEENRGKRPVTDGVVGGPGSSPARVPQAHAQRSPARLPVEGPQSSRTAVLANPVQT